MPRELKLQSCLILNVTPSFRIPRNMFMNFTFPESAVRFWATIFQEDWARAREDANVCVDGFRGGRLGCLLAK